MTRTQKTTMVACLLLTSCLMGVSHAQTDETVSTDEDQVPVLEQKSALAPAAEPLPLPGEEVMRPTEHGIRLTPRIARFMATQWLKEMDEHGGDYGEDQRSRMAEVMARRMMQVANKYGQELGPFMEFTYESMIRGQGQIPPEDAQEFAQYAKKGAVPAMREFAENMVDDFRPLVDDATLEEIKEFTDEWSKGADRLDAKMDQWLESGLEKGENPFEGLKDSEMDENGKPKKPRSKPMQIAEWQANRNIDKQSIQGWKQFLHQVRIFLHYDDEQYAKGLELLKQYQQKARKIMTKEWREQVRKNRIKVHFGKMLRKKPMEPWFYYMANEYDELLKPVLDLGHAFHRDVMALATPTQREKALAELQQFATNHGLLPEEMSAETLHLAGLTETEIPQEQTATSETAADGQTSAKGSTEATLTSEDDVSASDEVSP